MASPTSKKTSWLKDKLTRRTSSDKSTNNNEISEVNVVQYKSTTISSHDSYKEETDEGDWEVLTIDRREDHRMDEGSSGQGANKSSRKVSGGYSKILASPNLGGRSSVSGVSRPSLKHDKKLETNERPSSAGATVQRSTGASKKKMLTVANQQHDKRTPSPNLERSSSQRSSFRRRTNDPKSSSPGPREVSPDPQQPNAFSKVRDTLLIRKGKKKKTKKMAYSVPDMNFTNNNKYQDPFESLPDFGDGDKIDAGTGHEFIITTVPHNHPEYCDYCQQAAWGHYQVLKCSSK
jgi:hypothetical protein